MSTPNIQQLQPERQILTGYDTSEHQNYYQFLSAAMHKFSEHGIIVGCIITGNVANLLMNFTYQSYNHVLMTWQLTLCTILRQLQIL